MDLMLELGKAKHSIAKPFQIDQGRPLADLPASFAKDHHGPKTDRMMSFYRSITPLARCSNEVDDDGPEHQWGWHDPT